MQLLEWMNQSREQRLAEVGTEPLCPFCASPRVLRSDYIRCNPCGVNWNSADDIFKDPRTKATRFMPQVLDTGAQPAR